MTTNFAAYLDDQDLIRMEGGESVMASLPFTLTSGSKTIELLPTEEEKQNMANQALGIHDFSEYVMNQYDGCSGGGVSAEHGGSDNGCKEPGLVSDYGRCAVPGSICRI